MWLLYIGLPLSIIIGIILLIKYQKRPEQIIEESPKQKILVTKIENNIENLHKKFRLEDNQVIVIFKNDTLYERLSDNEFSISTFASTHDIDTKKDDFDSYHFYIFNESQIINLSINIKNQIRMIDVEYGFPIALLPKAKISIKYKDLESLFHYFSLFRIEYSYSQFFIDLMPYLNVNITNGIIQFCHEQKISFIMIDYYLEELEQYITKMIHTEMAESGLVVDNLEFMEFNIVDSSEMKNFNQMMLKNHKFKLLNYTYLDERKKQLMDKINYKKTVKIDEELIDKDLAI